MDLAVHAFEHDLRRPSTFIHSGKTLLIDDFPVVTPMK